jgi:cytochrome c biogenesis protein
MSETTQGVRIRTGSQTLRSGIELLSSMRFAIALLTVICIASVIGTVLKQHEPAINYVNQFGPFWAELFAALQLNAVYSAWWFLVILAFLVISTSLCIARNTPKILVDLKTYKENIREQNLRAFHHKAEATLAQDAATEARRIGQMLVGGGWKVKLQQRDTAAGPGTGWMVAAKAGAANKIGYIAAHSAIVLVCVGGLLDGDLIVRAQMWWGGKTPFPGGGMIADVGPEHRLSERNPTFRGNLVVTEGARASTAILSQSDGVLLQELPFSVELKKFIIEHYPSGMPKLFASEVVIHDKATGEAIPARIEVNHPAHYKGVEIYQSSFDDGGSAVVLRGVPLTGGSQPFSVQGVVGGKVQLAQGTGEGPLSLEFTSLRTINVENFGDDGSSSGADVRKVDLRDSIDARLGAANKTVTSKDLRNVGPSIGYKLRDAAGQAREFHNYMLPVDLGEGGPAMFLYGVRDKPSEPFRYLRIPADDRGEMDGFLRMHAALADPAVQAEAVRRYVARAVDPARAQMVSQLTESAARSLALFAGSVDAQGNRQGGLAAVSQFMEANVPEAERARAGEVLIRILNGTLFELAQLTRERAGLAPLENNEQTLGFMTQSVLALSDVQFYPAPLLLGLQDFTQVQASVFQVARAPGKNIVYLGCALLILGVFAMLYIRERRVWVWIAPRDGATHATMALSTNRKTMDGDREFAQLTDKLIGVAPLTRRPGDPA